METEQRNRMVATTLIVAAVLVASWASLLALNAATYDKFRIDGNFTDGDYCKDYYATCTCYGSLAVLESYPPQYRCGGVEVCHDVDRTICPA